MKKVLSLFLILLLTACSSTGSNFVNEEEETVREYIEPVNQNSIYSYLSDELKEVFPENNQDNYIFNDIGMDMPNCVVNDYYDKQVDFNDYKDGDLIIEVSASWCTHCADQVAYNNQILENSNAKLIQFFIEGNKEEVKSFFDNEDVEIPTNIEIIPADTSLRAYFVASDIEMVPTFYFYKNGKLTYMYVGNITYDEFNKYYDYIFGDKALTKETLVDNNGNNIFDYVRDYDDVLNDLSTASKDKLALIENSEELTVSVIGKDVFGTLYDEVEGTVYTIDDWNKYLNKEFVVFYLGNINNNLEGEINIINEFIDKHKDLDVVTILVDSKDISTSDAYTELGVKLNCDVVSSNAEIPTTFLDTLIMEYPACLFIQDNKFMGGFYDFDGVDKIERGYETFLGDESIAIVSNNK